MIIQLCNEALHLLPQKALYWPNESLLALSDVHIGKAESFQQFGIPIPSGSHLEDLNRITELIKFTQARNVYILGDLIHKKNSWTLNIIEDLNEFFAAHTDVQFTLLIGNHERGSIEYLQNFPITLVEGNINLNPFCFTHGHLENKEENFVIQGHVHPVVRLSGGGTKLRLPCFVIEKNSLTLPSFGTLTGGFEIKTSSQNRVFVPTETKVIELSP